MVVSIFLARALGIYFFIISLAMFMNAFEFDAMLEEIIDSPALLFLTAILTLMIGILLVISHSVWQMNWKVVITIIAWLTLVKGTLRVLFPLLTIKWMSKFMQSDFSYYFTACILLLLGAYLGYMGFIAHPTV